MTTARISSILIPTFLLAVLTLPVRGGNGVAVPEGGEANAPAADSDPYGLRPVTVNPAMGSLAIAPFVIPTQPPLREGVESPGGVSWGELFRSSGRFLAIEHSFRLLTEPGTRSGLKGSFFGNYSSAASNLHGWADGDEFYVNYVGHPMQGAAAGYLWVQNDRAYRHAQFGRDPVYWKSRLRAAAFVLAYSTQFEIGPVSEASIGAIQASFPQQGFVDHVITPAFGMAWMIGEDVVDQYVIKRFEGVTANRWARLLVRSSLNPARTFSNVVGGRAPWSRESRLGVKSYDPAAERLYSSGRSKTKAPSEIPDTSLAPPFEFALTFQPERFGDGAKSASCLGGGAVAGFRLAPSWQLITDVGGCKMTGLETNLSGDSLTYMVGPRWLARIRGPWSAHLQVLVGGNKLTEERMYPERKRLLEAAAVRDNKQPPVHADYTDQTESNGFAVASGGGVDYELNRALTIRVADFSYRHSWAAPLWGRDFSSSMKFTSGLVLRMGTW